MNDEEKRCFRSPIGYHLTRNVPPGVIGHYLQGTDDACVEIVKIVNGKERCRGRELSQDYYM